MLRRYHAPMNARLLKPTPALALFAAGFFCSGWDLLLARKVGGFTLKAYQPLFLLCALTLLWRSYRTKALSRHFAPLCQPFALAFLAMAFFYLGMAPWSAFPLKSFLYSCWLLFDIGAIWLSAQLLAEETSPETWAVIASLPILFSAAVIVTDFAAYPFGFVEGLIGHNQEAVVRLGISRPHSFSSEPSYAASLLCLGLFTLAPYALQRARRKWLAGLGAVLVLFAIVCTTSRTGWGTLALGVALLIVLPALSGAGFPRKPVLAIAAAIPLLSTLFVLAMPSVQRENLQHKLVDGLITGKDSSGVSRLKALALAANYARETHGLGTGMGASWKYFRDHGGYDYNFQGSFTDQENGNEIIMSTWGQLLAEGGVIASLLYALAGFFLLRSAWRAWHVTGSALAYGSIVAALLTFGFLGFWLGNVCRGDIWVWYALWSAIAASTKA